MKRNLILLTVLLAALSAFSAEYYVDASRPDDSGAATNWATAKQTIQAAVDIATDGDTVLVTNGVYATGGMVAPVYKDWDPADTLMNRICVTKAITVRSVNGAEVTVIRGTSDNGTNGPAAVRCVMLFPGAVMEGFTLTGGHTYADWNGGWGDGYGGGAFMLADSVLNNCVLIKNSAVCGGGAFCWEGNQLNNCLLIDNMAGYCGGVLVRNGTLNNCTVSGNTAREFSESSVTSGGTCGGVDLSGGGVMNNCIAWGNAASSGISNIEVSEATIRNTCSSPLPEGEGNICADPMFKNPSGNYRLRQGSPCVDAGSNSNAPTTDLDGIVRPVDGDNNGSAIADMGCYELNAASLPKTYFVDASRPDDSGAATNWTTAKQTIQAAVDLATDDDTVWVTNGVYDAGGAVAPQFDPYNNENFVTSALTNRVCITKAITVRSVNGAEATIIQGASDNGTNGPAAVRCVQLFPGAVMEGFTLMGGYTSGGYFFEAVGGGALLLTNAVLNRCLLTGNSAAYGGGACCLGGGTLNNCTLSGNSTVGDGGGGVFCSIGGTLNNCLLSGNTARWGGGALLDIGILNNCTLTGNSADYGGGLFMMVGSLNNCIVWGNTAPSYSNIETWGDPIRNTCSSPLPEGEGNICADPMFKNPSSNFHLRQGSPCVDAGSNDYAPATDLDGVARPVDGDNNGSAIADMGCYEWNVSLLPKTYYVDASRPDDSGAATNWATAKQTIQASVDLANDEDTVWVTNGVYDIGGMVAPTFRDSWGYLLTSALTNRVCLTKAITVRSVNGAAVTIIQGASDNGANGPAAIRCVRLFPGAVMEGFTLTGGHTYADSNGGWYDDAGGGALLHANAVLNSCILNGNSAFYEGGGVLVLDNGMLNNCLLAGNSATYRGGGVSLEHNGTLNNCTVSRNLVTDDGSIGTYGSGVFAGFATLNNCVVWGNTGAEKNIAAAWSATLMILNTCSSPLPEGEGNICADPMFVDATNGNFQLQAGSPCINAGNNSTVSTTNDLSGNPRIISGTVDMGAYEFYGAQDDYDGDGIPNAWEIRHFGNIGRAVSTAICSNGFNTILDAYIAGLDPNDPQSIFRTSFLPDGVLQWNAVSGRIYSIYWSTNLLNGFQPLATNIPWTAAYNVRKADGSGFYKIHVELAP